MGAYWLLFVAALVILAQAFVLRRGALRGLEYERYFSTDACFEGEQVQLVERIANRKLLPVPWLLLEAMMPGSLLFHRQSEMGISAGELYQNHSSLFSLMPYTEVTRRHDVRCSRRGCYSLNSAAMTGGDLLGMSRATRQISLDCKLLVYPRDVALEDMPLPSRSWLGDLIVRRWIVEDPFLMSGVREYSYGDPMNRVHWKATARSGKLQVQQKSFTADPNMLICVNIDNSPDNWRDASDPELIEAGIAYAGSIARRAIAQGLPVGFATNGSLLDSPREAVRIPCRSGEAHLRHLYETMAMIEVKSRQPFADMLAAETEHNGDSKPPDYLLITAYVDEPVQQQIDRLRKLGATVDIMRLTDADKPGGRRAGSGEVSADETGTG